MKKETVLDRIKQIGIVAVVRADSSDQAIRICEACAEGGISAVEITFTVPRAHTVVADLRKRFQESDVLVGAGTVLDPETARIAILDGAAFIVAPSFNADTIKLCNRYRIPCMPGAMTVTEVITAMEAGADIVKIFPGEVFGPSIIKAIKGPLPQAELMPTGGVNPENAAEWIKAGACALGAGGQLTAGAKTGDYAAVISAARKFRQAVDAARALA